jgi:carbonic anhydrase/acetyltransferase-like protein (isoleucine patch superfamily)
MTIEDFRKRDPAWNRRYSMPFEERIEGSAEVSWGAELDRCVIIAPNGNVSIGHSRLEQCVIVEPCTIGDGVVAVAAILQGYIENGARIEAHADITGTVQFNAVVGRGVVIEYEAVVGVEANVGDNTIVHHGAYIGAGARIGAQSDIGERATVAPNAVLPARSVLRPGAEAFDASDARLFSETHPAGEELGPRVQFRVVDELDDEPTGGDEYEDEYDPTVPYRPEPERKPQEPPALSIGRWARPGDMVSGQPTMFLENYRPGTPRSWVLSKLARIANSRSKDGRLTKKMVQEQRPDLLELPVTKEVLKIAPPVTDEQLSEMSFESLSPAAYDVYMGRSFHSGDYQNSQMLGPKTNDVFVFSVPREVMQKIGGASTEGLPSDLKWDGPIYTSPRFKESFGEVVRDHDSDHLPYSAFVFGGGFSTTQEASMFDNFASIGEARAWVERWTKALFDKARYAAESQRIDDLFSVNQSHPDAGVPYAIGWARLLVYPNQTVVVVEIQSDRDWMKFRYNDDYPPALALRKLYYDNFAADALNVVVEWAFTNRYSEVLVLDHKSRAALGGDPPRSFYEDAPKKYTVSPPVPLSSGTPFDYVTLYPWVPRDLKVRRIIPNRRRP